MNNVNIDIPVYLLESTDNSILYQIPAGKPNPNEDCKAGLEERSRVYQAQQKGDDCWFRAMKWLVPSIGKKYSKEFEQARSIEARCSQRRKAWNKACGSLAPSFARNYISQTPFIEFWSNKTKTEIQTILNENSLKKLGLSAEESEYYNKLLKEFLEQDVQEKIYAFFKTSLEKQEKQLLELQIEINKKFLTNWFSPEEVEKKVSAGNTDLLQLSYRFERQVQVFSMQLYGLEKASWTPKSSIDNLISEIRKRGPAYVVGRTGPFYTAPPSKMEKTIGGRTIYYWPKDTPKKEMTRLHSILIVGADKKKGLVYYIEPNCPSDPQNPDLQKIFATSYANLIKNTFTVDGYGPDEMLTDREYSFALFGPRVKIIKNISR